MLPYPRDPDFPAALKARRELRGMSRAALARAAGVHEVMPRRYEEPDCGEFARPRPDSTWLALNRALGFQIPTDIDDFISKTESIYSSGLFESGPLDSNNQWEDPQAEAGQEVAAELMLKDASLEDIVKLLHSRNIEPTFRHLI
ncbi:helix-turn-helix domain-containing protein [Pseudomonas frederiksbergensis]|uniref:helix-turn-helix domain-containing protein n=1 Tax=Pseudomonas frederiksbergensis TaxID=104087 RepID=UPI000F488CE8|nr:helix-turn-helix transcriptional regulator [Pseudomonas frederiksbergensis]